MLKGEKKRKRRVKKSEVNFNFYKEFCIIVKKYYGLEKDLINLILRNSWKPWFLG